MQSNRLQAIVAGTLGYSSTMKEKERMEKFKEATEVIRQVDKGEILDSPVVDIIRTTMIGIKAFNHMKEDLEDHMEEAAKKLPVADWVSQPDQRGFAYLFLAIVIGETGNLSNYANPAKVWRRLGCMPWTFEGETRMGSTWRYTKGLPSEEWVKFGYSKRRRSIAYLIGQNIKMQNKGIYRARFDEAKLKYQEAHPDYKKGRCDRHGMLVATKLLLKNLWIEWQRKVNPNFKFTPWHDS
jgi:hypothetical protein